MQNMRKIAVLLLVVAPMITGCGAMLGLAAMQWQQSNLEKQQRALPSGPIYVIPPAPAPPTTPEQGEEK